MSHNKKMQHIKQIARYSIISTCCSKRVKEHNNNNFNINMNIQSSLMMKIQSQMNYYQNHIHRTLSIELVGLYSQNQLGPLDSDSWKIQLWIQLRLDSQNQDYTTQHRPAPVEEKLLCSSSNRVQLTRTAGREDEL